MSDSPTSFCPQIDTLWFPGTSHSVSEVAKVSGFVYERNDDNGRPADKLKHATSARHPSPSLGGTQPNRHFQGCCRGKPCVTKLSSPRETALNVLRLLVGIPTKTTARQHRHAAGAERDLESIACVTVQQNLRGGVAIVVEIVCGAVSGTNEVI